MEYSCRSETSSRCTYLHRLYIIYNLYRLRAGEFQSLIVSVAVSKPEQVVYVMMKYAGVTLRKDFDEEGLALFRSR